VIKLTKGGGKKKRRREPEDDRNMPEGARSRAPACVGQPGPTAGVGNERAATLADRRDRADTAQPPVEPARVQVSEDDSDSECFSFLSVSCVLLMTLLSGTQATKRPRPAVQGRAQAQRGGQRHHLAVDAHRHTRGRPWHGVRPVQSIPLITEHMASSLYHMVIYLTANTPITRLRQ
jgi:hypothetical protein